MTESGPIAWERLLIGATRPSASCWRQGLACGGRIEADIDHHRIPPAIIQQVQSPPSDCRPLHVFRTQEALRSCDQSRQDPCAPHTSPGQERSSGTQTATHPSHLVELKTETWP